MSLISGPKPYLSIFEPKDTLKVENNYGTADDYFTFKNTTLSPDRSLIFSNISHGSHIIPIAHKANSILEETKELWIKVDGPGVILSEQGDTEPNKAWYYSQLEVVGDYLFCGIWSNQLYKFCLGKIEYGRWHHIVWRYKNRTLDGFLDGVQVPGISVSRVMPTMHGYKLYYLLGHGTSSNMGCGKYFHGSIALFRLWTTALTDLQIRTNFNMNRVQIMLKK